MAVVALEVRPEGEWSLPASVLAMSADELMAVAERAQTLAEEAVRLRSVLGDRPRIDFAAEREALSEWQSLQHDRRAVVVAREERLRAATWANVTGIGWLGAAVTLALFVGRPMGTTIDLAVALAATTPVAGCVAGWTKARRARTAVAARRISCADALERAGVRTMGELRARRIVADSWARRRDALRMADKQADDALSAWHELVGPQFAPSDAAVLVERCREVRNELLDRIKLLLAGHLQERATDDEAETKVILPFPDVPEEPLPGSRVSAGLERLQNLKLRLWRSA